MSDKPCPECGCFMEEFLDDWFRDEDGNPQIESLTLHCPCCDYEETSYDEV